MITGVIIFVMMPKMVLFQPNPNSPLHPKLVNRIMDRIVTDVTKAEPGRHSRDEAARCPPLVSEVKKECVALAENIRRRPLPAKDSILVGRCDKSYIVPRPRPQ
jgi:hypothetical protein